MYGRLRGADSASITLRLDATLPPPKPGSVVGLRVRPHRLHWFDSNTGRRVA